MCNSVIFTVQRYEEIAHELKPYVLWVFFAIFAKLSGRWFEKIFFVVVR